MSEFDVANYCIEEVNERVRCYRFELGSVLEKVSLNTQKIFERLLEQTLRLNLETNKRYENQIQSNLNTIDRLEKEKRILENDSRDLRNRYFVQESLLKITKINIDALQS